MTDARPSWPARALAGLVRVYQLTLSPLKRLLLGPHAACRFHPTCSEYSRQAILRHGLFRGAWLAVKRIIKCGPWHAGGEDPVPGNQARAESQEQRAPRD